MLAFAFCSALLFGCLGSQSKAAKLQDAAQNLNIAARFGRMDIATELVADKSQGDFYKKHMDWGRDVRVIDIEFQGVQLRSKDEATVTVAVGWQRPTEQELRVTHVMQTWQYGSKGWKLVDESRAAGDVGLLGEKTEVIRPEQRAAVHFKSVTIPSPY
jgi:hypothetical protein